MLTIWGRTSSINVQKVMWTVGELGLAHRRIDVGGAFGGLDTPEYGRMNPNRRIPTVQDGETVVWESNACVRYLAAAYGEGGLWPASPPARARSDMWMDWVLATLMPDMSIVFWQLVRTPAEKRDMAGVTAAAERLGPLWRILDEHLAGRPFVAGDGLTIGDIPAGAAYWRYRNLDVARPELANLERWYRSLEAREPYRQNVMLPLT